MQSYSLGFKEALVKKVLLPNSKSIEKLAIEAGVSEQALRNWCNKAKEGTLNKRTGNSTNRPAREKLSLVIESKTISESEKGQWLRKNGLHTEHITQYEQELRYMVEDKSNKEKQEKKKLIAENKMLKKELAKKEKALAEMAALYTLKKKAEELWGDPEDD